MQRNRSEALLVEIQASSPPELVDSFYLSIRPIAWVILSVHIRSLIFLVETPLGKIS